jgi:hypothetical protein
MASPRAVSIATSEELDMMGRREVVKFAAGGAAGTVLTPVPWKLLDDVAIWSQNWSWIPPVPRGELSIKDSRCTLCPAGCAVRARCVGDRAIGLEASNGGVLCAAGFGAHAVAYHPRRLRALPDRDRTMANIRNAVRQSSGKVAILDLGPRRALSALLAEAAQSAGAIYARMPDREEASLDALARIIGREPGTLGIDLEHTRTLISFGAPVLEGWAVPGRVMQRWRSGELRVVQIEARQSRTALAAAQWIPVEPGRETAVNLQQIAPEAPAVAVGGGDPAWGLFDEPELQTIARLNLELKALGREGGIVPRAPLPWGRTPAVDFAAVPDRSIQVLLLDASRAFETTPWPLVQRKLAARATVVVFAYKEDGFTRHADFVLPVTAPFESIDDVETPPLSAQPFYAVAPPLIGTPVVRETPVDYVNAILATTTATVEDTIKQRVAEFEAWKPERPRRLTAPSKLQDVPPRAPEPAAPLTLLVHGPRGSSGDETSPLLSKLYQESGLFTTSAIARLNPETARRFNLENNKPVTIETPYGSTVRIALFDPAVAPGTLEVASGPGPNDIAEICTDGARRNWRAVPAGVRRA